MPVAGLEVTFAAYLAVLLGTFVPVTFLIVLYSQVSQQLSVVPC
jgi:photosystem II reaction center protein PsbM